MVKKTELISLSLIIVIIVIAGNFAAYAIYPTTTISGCTIRFEVNETGDLEAYQGSTAEINITIFDVYCGLSHAALNIENLEFNYTQSPEFFATAPPLQNRTYNINITIPEEAETGEQTVRYIIMSNEKRVEKEFTLTILEKGTEQEEQISEEIQGEIPEEKTETIPSNESETEQKSSFFEKVRNFFKNIFRF